MDAIRIRHCRLRVLRHGGWSWGADPGRFVDQVTQRLPAWLMQALAEQLADCPPDVTIQRLHLRIPVRMSELHDLTANYMPESGGTAMNEVMQRALASLATALKDIPQARPMPRHEPAAVETGQAANEEISPTAVVDTLLAWQRANELPRFLTTADAATLRVWVRAALEELSAAANNRVMAGGEAARQITRLESLLTDGAASAALLAQELVRLIAGLVAPPGEAAADSVARSAEPVAPQAFREEPLYTDDQEISVERQTTRASSRRRRAPPARQPRRDPVPVESVLPFIVMGILSRRNYFEELRAALVCSDLLEQSGCFAAALAYKLSPPPNRGWDRSAATRRLAAAMCGLDEPPDNSRMDSFLRGLSTVCAPLDASLWPADRAASKQPGILVEKLDGALWAVLDIASSQPLGWFASPGDVLRVAELLPGRLWWLAPGAADSDFPDALQRLGLRAVAFGVEPRVAGWLSAGDSLSTNEPLLRRRAAELRRIFDEARELLATTHSEFVELRPLVLPARGPPHRAAEFSITLAVCSALGELADTLWRGREPTQPLLALRRFADLGGTVSVEEGRVLVRPALGRRFMDLSEHGLLRDIVGIPWWPGRRVEFAGP